jgi:hypothetical protein
LRVLTIAWSQVAGPLVEAARPRHARDIGAGQARYGDERMPDLLPVLRIAKTRSANIYDTCKAVYDKAIL